MPGADGEIRRIADSIKQVVEAKVVDAQIVGNHIEVEVELLPSGQKVWAEQLVASAGNGGGLVRVPTAGETCLVGLVDGHPSNAFVLGWLPSDSAMPLPSVKAGTTYLIAPADEPLILRAGTGANIKIEVDEGAFVNSGGGAVDFAALASKVQANEQQLATILSSHQHTYVLPLIPIAAAVTAPGAPPQTVPALQQVKASKTKVE